MMERESSPPGISTAPAARHDVTPFLDLDAAPTPPAPQQRWPLVVAALAGLVAGSLLTGLVLLGPSAPSPLPITASTFPEELAGMAREDLTDGADVLIGFGLDDERLASQKENFRFAFGGDGAQASYSDGSRGYAILAVVNGVMTPEIPTEGVVSPDGPVYVASLDAADVRCTTYKSWSTSDGDVMMNPETGELLPMFSICVLVDEVRNLSLRWGINEAVETGVPLDERVEGHAELLRGLHQDLLG